MTIVILHPLQYEVKLDLMDKENYTAKSIWLLRSIVVLAAIHFIYFPSFSQDCSLACNGTTQVSVDSDCNALITVDMILNGEASSCQNGNFGIVIKDYNGNIIAANEEPIMSGEWMGETLTVTVVDSVSGNTCWGNLIIEDKVGPIPENCGSVIDLECTDFDNFSGPNYVDGCGEEVSPVLLSETITPLNCDDDYVQEIVRTYVGTDSQGNQGPECTFTYRLKRIDFDDIVCPRGFSIDNGTALSCDGILDDPLTEDVVEDWDLDGDLYPDIEEFPGPTLNGVPLFPFQDIYCNVGVFYTDLELPKVGCIQKVLRTWSIREWHCGTEVTMECIQVFDITDLEPPVIECGGYLEVTTNVTTNPHNTYQGQVSCGAEILFPIPKITDNCTDNVVVDLTLMDATTGQPFEQINNYDPSTRIELPMGQNVVLITASDNCYNSSTCEFIVNVIDDTPPVAICDEFTVVGLTADGYASVPAETFDDGSYDDCRMKKFLVRRMDNDNCECEIPTYPDVDYLGEFEEHHYYISDKPVEGLKAFKLSEAMGGYAAVINSSKEGDWLNEVVRDEVGTGLFYYIGYSDASNELNFNWADGSNNTYTNWATGMPQTGTTGDVSDYVIVKPDSEWGNVMGSRQELYVFEVEDICTFSTYTRFCCKDVGPDQDQMVVFRAIDICGNYNDCMVNVEVQDKLDPVLSCPPDLTFECDYEYTINSLDDLDRFFGGVATDNDNCGSTIDFTVIDNLDQCNQGELIIKYTAVDAGGRIGSCDQVITFTNGDPFTEEQIIWPLDIDTVGCFDPADYHPDFTGYPEFLDDQCDLVGSNWEDQLFVLNDQPDNACFKILRTWQVIDWCQRDENDDIFTWDIIQIIKIGNEKGPAVECPDDIIVCTYDPSCDMGTVNLILNTTGDDCTEPDNIEWKWEIDLHCDGSIDTVSTTNFGPTADASGSYPLGTHCITWQFSDQCGNPTTCQQAFTVFNCKAPTPYCINGLAVDLMPTDTNADGIEDWGMVELWANDFDAGSFHPCGYPVILSFQQDTTIKNLMLDCTTLGDVDVEIWSSILLPDGSLVQSFCETFVNVQDNNNVCPDRPGTGGATGGDGVDEGENEEEEESEETDNEDSENGEADGEDGSESEEVDEEDVEVSEFRIQGSVYTEKQSQVENVVVSLMGANIEPIMTDDLGSYIFPSMPLGGEYTVDPEKVDDPLNGVSTLDLVDIQKHILNLQTLESPYKMIAADINNDQRITSQDLVQLRKLILNIYDDFPNNDSWRFIDQNFVFQDTDNALNEIFSEDYNIQSLEDDMNIDFVGVKIGDVNNSVIANLNSGTIGSRNNGNVTPLYITKTELEPGNSTFSIYTKDELQIQGFQFSLKLANGISIKNISSSSIGWQDANYTKDRLNSDSYNVSWSSADAIKIDENGALLTIQVNDEYGTLSPESIQIDNQGIAAEMYSSNREISTPELEVFETSGNEISYDYRLFQNSPNPFTGTTELRFTLPSDMNATLTVSDLSGKVMYRAENLYNRGVNIIELNAEEILSTGVMYYTLETKTWKSTRKMVVIR